jgi:hypothetical protein
MIGGLSIQRGAEHHHSLNTHLLISPARRDCLTTFERRQGNSLLNNHFGILRNTETVHNLIVCTLCSCYLSEAVLSIESASAYGGCLSDFTGVDRSTVLHPGRRRLTAANKSISPDPERRLLGR